MQNSPQDFYKKLLGLKGEVTATNYLISKGYKIIEKNYRTKFSEVDLIALYGDFLVFIEVKTRTSKQFGMPREAVGYEKQRKYVMTAEFYLQKHSEYDNKNVRFDVIDIIGDDITHIENAFYA